LVIFQTGLGQNGTKNLTFSRRYFSFGIMPNSPTLWFAAGMLWIMDASINVSMEPFRAFVGDNLEKQRTMGLCKVFYWDWRLLRIKTTVNFTYLGVDNTAPLGIIPDSVKYSFYFGGIAFIVTVLWTVIT
jgi:maltose/moltooligosaccharide transporter